MSYSASQLTVPPGFPELLQGLAREVLRNQPQDIVAFAHEHFSKLIADRGGAEAELAKAAAIEQETAVLKPNADATIPEAVKQAEEEEELPELDSFDNAEVQAITKIQSGFRGMQARKKVEGMKQEKVEEPAVEQKEEEEEELPELDSFDNKEVQAITKIQSGFRGMQARKRVNDIKQEQAVEPQVEAQEEEEELPKLDEFNDGEVQAITKIQSGFRGMQARKQVQELKAAKDDDTEVVEEKAAAQEEEELPNLEDFDNKEVQAITKIQSGFRGMQARKEVKKLKDDNQPTDGASTPTEGPDDQPVSPEVTEELQIERPTTAATETEIPASARTITNED